MSTGFNTWVTPKRKISTFIFILYLIINVIIVMLQKTCTLFDYLCNNCDDSALMSKIYDLHCY